MKAIYSKNAPEPIGPYSQAIEANGTLYLSGMIAIDPASGNLVTDELEAETRQVMSNIKALLEDAGSGLDKVIKCSIFLKDLGNFGKINEIYGSYFEAPFPARECVEVARLPKDVNVEISVVALA